MITFQHKMAESIVMNLVHAVFLNKVYNCNCRNLELAQQLWNSMTNYDFLWWNENISLTIWLDFCFWRRLLLRLYYNNSYSLLRITYINLLVGHNIFLDIGAAVGISTSKNFCVCIHSLIVLGGTKFLGSASSLYIFTFSGIL